MSTRSLSAIVSGIFFLGFLSTCRTPQTPPTPTASPSVTEAPPATIQNPTVAPPTARKEPTATFESYLLPLTEYGPNFIGKRTFDFVDSSRNDRQVGITVWYPAIKPQGFSGTSANDAEPDPAGAPYPMILSSTKNAGFFAPHLVTHGFVVVGVNKLDTYPFWDNNVIDQPMDILFALDQVGSNPLAGLEGILDSENVGAMGYSFDGFNALAMSGARVDPEYFLGQCTTSESNETALFSYSSKWQCPLMSAWDEVVTRAGESITISDDGLWQPITDARIRAVMPLAPDGWLLFGERGLAAVDRPVLIIVGGNDIVYPEDSLIFANLGTPDRFLITFVGQNHMMIYNPEQVAHMKHFAVAFFGTYLQGRQEYAEYFSQDFIAQYPALAGDE